MPYLDKLMQTQTETYMTKTEAVSQAVNESRNSGGERRYAVRWPLGQWTVETRRPSKAAECLLAVDGRLGACVR